MTSEEFDSLYTGHLNPQQLDAVHAVDGAILLLAVPGSGKTTVLVTRLGYMVCCRGIDPASILTMTYTVAATREMKQRFARLFGEEIAGAMEFRTINGVSSRIIAYYSRMRGRGQAFDLLENEGEIAQLIGGVYQEIRRDFPTPSNIREVRTAITYVKNMMLTEEEIRELDTGIEKFPELYRRYCEELRRRRLMDYDDQMSYALTILQSYPDILEYFQDQYPYLCVDESQDTSKIQHAIIRLLAKKHGNLFMVGDEDQSIYGFRAAYPEALMQFESEHPGARVMLMEQNYRSTPEILKAANAFICKNKDRYPKTIRPNRVSGEQISVIHITDPAVQFPYLYDVASHCTEETAVLYRNNDSALPLIDLFERNSVPYNCRQFEDTFFTHRIVLDVTDIIHFAQDPHNVEIFLRIYPKFCAGISRTAAETACRESRLSGKPLLHELLRCQDLSRYTRERVTELFDTFPQLLEDSAEVGIKRIFGAMGYGTYVEYQKLDSTKYTTLCLLARQEQNLVSLLQRLDDLRNIIATHVNSPDTKFLLSTVHSSKGLEYHTVYLHDMLDGILPSTPNPVPTDSDAMRQYQEDRRVYYVAMTRAKNKLFLFHCGSSPSAFTQEVLQVLPQEKPEENSLFAALPRNLCGKRYTHRQYGAGTVAAHGDNRCLIIWKDRCHRVMTLGQMLDERAILWQDTRQTPPEPQKPAGPSREELEKLAASIQAGTSIRHSSLGHGTVEASQPPYVKIIFEGGESKLFHLQDSLERGFLFLE